jgi:hypothetical protein
VQNLTLLLVKTPRQFRELLTIRTVGHREIDTTFLDSFLCIVLRIHGGGNNLNAFIFEPVGARKGRQLLLAVGSPVPSVQQDNAPVTCQIVRQAHLASTHLRELNAGEWIAPLEHGV